MNVKKDIYYYDMEKEAQKRPVSVRKTSDILAYMHEYERLKGGDSIGRSKLPAADPSARDPDQYAPASDPGPAEVDVVPEKHGLQRGQGPDDA